MTVQADAARVLLVYRAALLASSASVSRQALSWFDGVDLSNPAAGLRLAERVLPAFRANAELGIAFYRLYAALLSGRTVDHPLRKGRQKQVLFADLVADFEKASGLKLGGMTTGSVRKFRVDPGLESAVVRSVFESNRLQAKRQFEKRWENRVRAEANGGGSSEGDRAWYAGVAQQVAANGARDVTAVVGNADSKLIGWVRVSGSGSPCAFCAMHISRGIGYRPYRTERSAGGRGNDYHPNCKCYAVPVFTEADWDTNEVFRLNREMEEEWGASGSGSLSEWRSYYDKKFGVRKVGRRGG